MTFETAPPPTPTPRQATHRALDELRAALDMRGITLPSLDLAPLTLAAIHNGALVRDAKHDHFGVYRDSEWQARPEDLRCPAGGCRA
ncbi:MULTISPECIES: hypothetical protein [Streptomyces]|uniref:Uncharacterized protein n=1 Tax=Streptomyces lonegramiae TaxID=3075524 RepID=A0ABU2XCY1_9ACTN|nr:hypothetical protein [Streptomyces sp. DSM 41529]MDT0543329.1 hypothetical protein [Streptomyces sp. DSM 41529]